MTGQLAALVFLSLNALVGISAIEIADFVQFGGVDA